MVINNTSKHVIVLKAVGMPNLRLFPGYNTVEKNGLEKYFVSKAAEGQRKQYLDTAHGELLTTEEQVLADKAREKNEKLNRAQRIVKQQNETLSQNSQTIDDQAALIKQLKADVMELKKAAKKNK